MAKYYLDYVNPDGTLQADCPERYKKLYEMDKANYEKGLYEYIKMVTDYRQKTNLSRYLMLHNLQEKGTII